MYNVQLFGIPTMSATSRTFNRRLSNTNFVDFLNVVISFGRPIRCSYLRLKRLRLNSATQHFTVINDEADSP